MAPYLYLDPDVGGLTIGIQKPGGDDENDGRQSVAFFPWAEIGIPQWKNGSASERKRAALLSKHGWTREDRELRLGAPSTLNHRHVRVEWHFI